MASNAIVSRGEAFGRRVASGLKRLIAAERRFIEQSGEKARWVKWGLAFIKLAVVITLASLALWLVVIILPVVLILWAMAASAGGAETFRDWQEEEDSFWDYPAQFRHLNDKNELNDLNDLNS
jgi:fatty acid desaturase